MGLEDGVGSFLPVHGAERALDPGVTAGELGHQVTGFLGQLADLGSRRVGAPFLMLAEGGEERRPADLRLLDRFRTHLLAPGVKLTSLVVVVVLLEHGDRLHGMDQDVHGGAFWSVEGFGDGFEATQ